MMTTETQTTTSSNSISSIESDGSTLHETHLTWPGTLEVNPNSNSNNNNNTAPGTIICDSQIASESLRDMIQALGYEKMGKIRSLIAVHQRNSRISLPPAPISPARQQQGSDPTNTSGGSSSTPPVDPERPTDEVALTICDLESALGPEDMSELRSSMLSVRRQSVHLDVWISSDMTEEELQRSVEAVKTRQDEVLELIFQEIMGLIATKLGVELDSDLQATLPAEVMAMKRDESNMLKVPEMDVTGRRASTSTQKSVKKKESVNRQKGTFDGYSLCFYGRKTPEKSTRVGDAKGKGKSGNWQSKEEYQEKNSKKKKRGCLGFCTLM